MKTETPAKRILILGGGFGGVYAALYLQRRLGAEPQFEIALVNEDNFFLFTPMLHEVAASDIDPGHIVTPIRKMLPGVRFYEAVVKGIDLAARSVTLAVGIRQQDRVVPYDYLLIALGSETNFFGIEGLSEKAMTMKSLTDAMFLRNRILAALESAAIEEDEQRRRELLTFVVAGGGFAGVETIGAVNDFVRDALRYYPNLRGEEVRVALVHPKDVILPELGEELGRYAQKKLSERQVEVILDTHVTGFQDEKVLMTGDRSIPAHTLIWAAGVSPSPAIAALPCKKEKGRIEVNSAFEVEGFIGVWALGDCAWQLNPDTGQPYPPTAQHAIRQGKVAAENICAEALGYGEKRAFRYKMVGQLAAIGQRTGVANIFGVNFSGFLAWWLWRTVYLAKLPGTDRKLRVVLDWTLDLFFSKDLVQFLTITGVEKLCRRVAAAKAASRR